MTVYCGVHSALRRKLQLTWSACERSILVNFLPPDNLASSSYRFGTLTGYCSRTEHLMMMTE